MHTRTHTHTVRKRKGWEGGREKDRQTDRQRQRYTERQRQSKGADCTMNTDDLTHKQQCVRRKHSIVSNISLQQSTKDKTE